MTKYPSTKEIRSQNDEPRCSALCRVAHPVVVAADGWSESLRNRIKWLRSEIPDAPLVLLLNYPREHELETIRNCGVSEIVSKPFELEDLQSAVIRAVEHQARVNLESPA